MSQRFGLELSSGFGLGLRFGLLGSGGVGFEAVAVVVGFADVAVVGEPVEQRCGQLGITEHAGPFGEAEVGGTGETRVLVELADQVESKAPPAARTAGSPVRRGLPGPVAAACRQPSPVRRR